MLEPPHLIIMMAIYAITNRKPPEDTADPITSTCMYVLASGRVYWLRPLWTFGSQVGFGRSWLRQQDTLSLFFAGIEDPGSGHAFPAARLVGGCVAPVLSLPLIIESRASWSVKYKFEDIINT
ncbi:unnamed protein product [Brassica oleracea]